MIDIVFFDAGDTILCPQPSFPALATQVLNGRGHALAEMDVITAARAVAEHFRRVEGLNLTAAGGDRNRAFWMELYADMLSQLGIADEGAPLELVDTFSDPSRYDLFPDALPALEELQARGVRLGMISNFEPWLEGLLKRLEVLDRFDVVAISGVVGWEKPDRRIFEWAIFEARVPAMRCMHVGDQPYFDVEPALALGLQAVLVDRHGRYPDLDAAYPRIETLAELPPLVK